MRTAASLGMSVPHRQQVRAATIGMLARVHEAEMCASATRGARRSGGGDEREIQLAPRDILPAWDSCGGRGNTRRRVNSLRSRRSRSKRWRPSAASRIGSDGPTVTQVGGSAVRVDGSTRRCVGTRGTRSTLATRISGLRDGAAGEGGRARVAHLQRSKARLRLSYDHPVLKAYGDDLRTESTLPFKNL